MGSVVKTVLGVALTVVALTVPGAQFLLAAGLSLTLGGISGMLAKKPKQNAATGTRLSKSLDPEAFRKILFGHTAGGADLRYWEVYGTDDKQYDEIVAVAGHKINGFVDFYIEDQQVTFSSGAAVGTYAGVLTRQTNDGTVGNAALTVGAGTKWTSAAKFRGSAHYALRWTYDQNKLPQGIPSRYTCVVEGALVYDPRKDTTVGGSGSHRYNDQTTWQYSPTDSNGQPIGRNNALQVLWYLLGWRINDTSSNPVLVAGRGVDPQDIDFASFIAAANDAEALQYYTDCILSTGDSHSTNESILTSDGAIGTLIDPGGLWTYCINKDDTSVVDVSLTDADVVDTGTVEWKPAHTMSEQYNRVVGTFIDPTSPSLYQPKPYPQAINTTYETADGFKKRKTLNYQSIQDGLLAQKVSTVVLNESRWQGEFTAKFNYKAIKTKLYGVISLSLSQYAFLNKLFRVLSMSIEADGITLRLGEIDSTIWSTGTPGTVNSSSPGGNGATLGAIPLSGVSLTAIQMVSGSATYPGIRVSWTAPSSTVTWVQIRYRKQGDTVWTQGPTVDRTVTSADLFSIAANTAYEVQTQTYSTFRVFSAWSGTLTLSATGGFVPPQATTDTSLVPDGDFSGGLGAAFSASWTSSGAGIARGATTSPAPGAFWARVGHGTAVGQWVESVDFTDFVAGQTLFASLYFTAVRNSGTNNLIVRTQVEWWNAAGGALTTDTFDSTVTGSTTGWPFVEAAVIAPVGAVRGRLRATFNQSAGATYEFDAAITALRVTRQAVGADITATHTALGDANRVRFSLFERDNIGWALYNPSALTVLNNSAAHNGASFGQPNDYYFARVNFTANSQLFAILTDSIISGNKAYRIAVTPGERLFVGAFVGTSLHTNQSWQLTANWKDDANNAVGTPASIASTSNVFGTVGQFATVPAGAVWVSFELYLFNNTGGVVDGQLVLGQPIVCAAGAAQTVFPAFSPGPSSEPGANLGAVGDANRVRFSKFEQDMVGWRYDTTGSPTVSIGTFHTSTDGDYIQVSGSFTAAGQQVLVRTNPPVTGGSSAFKIPVTAGERIFARALFNCSAIPAAGRIYLWGEFFNESNASLGVSNFPAGPVRLTTTPGWIEFGGFVTVPAGATYLMFEPICDNLGTGTATGSFSLAVKEPMVCGAAPNQTTFPSFMPGPSSEPGATAGSIADGNRVRFSLFEKGIVGYGIYDGTAASISALTTGVSGGLPYITLSANFTANGQELAIGTAGPSNSAYWIPVTAGERLFVSCLEAVSNPNSNCTFAFNAFFYNSAGGVVSGATIVSGNGSDGFATRRAGFVIVPAGAVFMQLRWHTTNNALGITGAVSLTLSQLMVCTASMGQTVFPSFIPGPSNEAGAEITRWIDGPAQSTSFKYDSTGATAESGEFNRDLTFKLMTSGGQIASGVTWSYKVLTGTFNTFTSASGAQSMSGSGTGTLTASSLGSSTATLEITATYAGQPYTLNPVTLSKVLAAAGGGGGVTVLRTKSSGFTGFSNTTPTDQTGALTAVTPSGVTALNCNVTLNAMPASGTTGSWTVNCKVYRRTTSGPGSWNLISTLPTSLSDWSATDVSGDYASFASSVHDTGLSASTSYDYYVEMYLSSGTRSHAVTGQVQITT